MFMIMHLIEEKYLDDVMMALIEAGIENTIVLSGENMTHKLTLDMPIFAGFRNNSRGRGYSKLVMGQASRQQVDFALQELKNAGIELLTKELAEIALLPVEYYYGSEK